MCDVSPPGCHGDHKGGGHCKYKYPPISDQVGNTRKQGITHSPDKAATHTNNGAMLNVHPLDSYNTKQLLMSLYSYIAPEKSHYSAR